MTLFYGGPLDGTVRELPSGDSTYIVIRRDEISWIVQDAPSVVTDWVTGTYRRWIDSDIVFAGQVFRWMGWSDEQ